MSALSFQVENVMAVADEAMPLLRKHAAEIPLDAATPLDPDWPKYAALDKAGAYHAVTARAGGELVGYASYHVSQRNLHYDFSFASNDICYIAPDHRKVFNGARLLQFAERSLGERGASLISRGVDRIVMGTKLGEHDIGPLLERLGYVETERVYVKKIR